MGLKVLICDDTAFMRSVISKVVTEAGFEVVGTAASGEQAVQQFEELKPDLVTMDVVMPDMGGIDAVRKIKELDPEARILMCSAIGQQLLMEEATKAGAGDYIVKPFQPPALLEAIDRVLQ